MPFKQVWLFCRRDIGSAGVAVLCCCGQGPISLTKSPSTTATTYTLKLHGARCGELKGAAEKPVRKNSYDTAESRYHYRAGSPDFAGKNTRLKNAILPGFVNVVFGLAKAETHS